jgi:tetratricopeptide (TPR) repeat protein
LSLFDRLRRPGQTQVVHPEGGRGEDIADAIREIRARASEGRRAEALALTRAALARTPDHLEFVALRGSLLFEWGRFREAREDLAFATSAGIDRPTLLLQSGWAALWSGDAVHAEDSMRRAVEADPANWRPHFGLGGALRAQRRLDEAVAAYERALECSPDNADAFAAIMGCHVDGRRFGDALRVAQHLRVAHPDDPDALGACAAVLIWNDQFAEAIAAYERIAELDAAGDDPQRMPLDAGFALREGGRVDASIAFYERALPVQPNPKAHMNYAFSLLKAGRVKDGFDQYDFRWMIEPLISLRPRLGKAVWKGQPLGGKTILVLDEQGFGDILQFLRYVPLVKARGARVMLLLRRAIAEVIDARCGVDQVVLATEPLPPFDFHVHLVGLPSVLGTDIDTIPNEVPYVFAPPERIAHWRARIPADRSLNVGLAWAGDPQGGRGRQKSTTLSSLAPWARLHGVRFYSLQKGGAAAEAVTPPDGLAITNLSPDIRDFADTAAIVECLDLVISVCTSVAHLAGAMGKPTWTMLAEPADWRWMEGRDDSPWYPTMRLFRQPRQGDWASVITEVGDALAVVTRDRSALRAPTPQTTRASAADAAARASQRSAVTGVCVAVEARHGIFELRREGTASERSINRYGEDLESQLELLRARIAAGATVLEAGSGIGAHAIPLAAHIGESGHLLLCESRRELLAILHNNLAANSAQGVTVLRTNLLGASGDPASGMSEDDSRAPIDRLDLRRLDWLKFGEGADAETILRGAARTLWDLRPRVFAAAADEQALARIAGVLRDFGYHCWRVDTPRFSAANFNRREDDMFDGGVAHAVLALPEEASDAPPEGLAALD